MTAKEYIPEWVAKTLSEAAITAICQGMEDYAIKQGANIKKTSFLEIAYNTIKSEFGITKEQIKSDSRLTRVTLLRILISEYMSKRMGKTFKEIGKEVNRDHSTISHYKENYWSNEMEFKYKELKERFYKSLPLMKAA